jgi:chemotaxis receptor (MCP) glutamine deamidase CheD
MNCEVATEVLQAEGFRVAASSMGGTSGLNIRFDTRTGEVLLRRLNGAVSGGDDDADRSKRRMRGLSL